MTGHASPILTSLLDTDAYKLHMQQAVFHRYHDITVAAEFRCRGDELLGLYADEIRDAITAMQHLALTDDEATWLSHLPSSGRITSAGYASSAITRIRLRCAIIMASWNSVFRGRGEK